jgi:hypothetical protein
VTGNFGAAVTLHGDHVAAGRRVLGWARIAQDLNNSVWRLDGSTGSFFVGGAATGSAVRTLGGTTSVSLGETDGTDFLAGLDVNSSLRRANSAGDFVNPDARIGIVAVRGRRLPAGDPTRFVIDSNFSAGSFGPISLVNAAGGAAYGLFVPDSEANFRSVRHRDTLNPDDSFLWMPGRPVPVVGSLLIEAV